MDEQLLYGGGTMMNSHNYLPGGMGVLTGSGVLTFPAAHSGDLKSQSHDAASSPSSVMHKTITPDRLNPNKYNPYMQQEAQDAHSHYKQSANAFIDKYHPSKQSGSGSGKQQAVAHAHNWNESSISSYNDLLPPPPPPAASGHSVHVVTPEDVLVPKYASTSHITLQSIQSQGQGQGQGQGQSQSSSSSTSGHTMLTHILPPSEQNLLREVGIDLSDFQYHSKSLYDPAEGEEEDGEEMEQLDYYAIPTHTQAQAQTGNKRSNPAVPVGDRWR